MRLFIHFVNECCCVLSGTYTLPGETEEDLIAVSSSSLCHHTLLEISSAFTDQRTHTPSAAENQVHTHTHTPMRLSESSQAWQATQGLRCTYHRDSVKSFINFFCHSRMKARRLFLSIWMRTLITITLCCLANTPSRNRTTDHPEL